MAAGTRYCRPKVTTRYGPSVLFTINLGTSSSTSSSECPRISTYALQQCHNRRRLGSYQYETRAFTSRLQGDVYNHAFLHVATRLITTTTTTTMQLQGKSFDGSSTLGSASHELEAIAGSARWITEYQPIQYAERRIIETLLFILWGFDICCAVAGQFGTYTAGMGGYLHVALFVARNENPLLVTLFQHVSTPTFWIGPLEFTYLGNFISDRRFYVTLGDFHARDGLPNRYGWVGHRLTV